ncbi:hypothetical protein SCUCBS95973_009365 [Sporothrix curviconia]|uniref:Uncharacterized protein n=1 Tax=Sporothrix curviconia TaxID=1260050 RepID=A0ABP0CXT2_9PEZI
MFAAANTVWQMLADRRIPATVPDDSDTESESTTSSSSSSSACSYQPSFCDVLVVKAMLQRHGRLPLELVDDIVDDAAYWAHAHAEVFFARDTGRDLTVPTGRAHPTGGNRFCLRTPPLGFQRAPVRGGSGSTTTNNSGEAARKAYTLQEPEPVPLEEEAVGGDCCSADDIRQWLPAGQAPLLEHPCRKIVFTIVSHDQGWANNAHRGDRYKGSYTWFDVGLERYGWRKGAEHKEASETESDEKAPFAPTAPDTATLYTLRPDVVAASQPPPNSILLQHPRDELQHPREELPPRRWRFDFPLNPGDDRLQSNKVATREFAEHTIVWSWTDEKPPLEEEPANSSQGPAVSVVEGQDPPTTQRCPLDKIGRGSETGDGSFVRNLRVGDVVTVWAKARFPGWSNTVRSVEVDVYWAV